MPRRIDYSVLSKRISQLPFSEDFKGRLHHASAKMDTERLAQALGFLEEADAEMEDLFRDSEIFGEIGKWRELRAKEIGMKEDIAAPAGEMTKKTFRQPRQFHVHPKSASRRPFPLPDYTMRQLLEVGAHFGHQAQRWNPSMAPYIYGERNGIHIIDLTQTIPLLDAALSFIRDTVSNGGKLLFVGTKRQAAAAVREAAEKCGQFYMNHRWLGGTMTNWQTVSSSIARMERMEFALDERSSKLTEEMRLSYERDLAKLSASLSGIRKMNGLPDALFVVDVNKEALAVAEANKLGIPVVAIVDTNCSPTGIDFLIPANDDTSKSISFFSDLVARAAISGTSSRHDIDEEDSVFANWELEDELEAAFEFDAEVVFE